jgi:secreted trypsin-like serine protease
MGAAPLDLHTGAYSVDSADATTAAVTGKAGVAGCAGDAGGPVFRETGGKATLVGLSSQPYQGGCFGADPAETRTGAIVARVDDLGSWVNSVTGAPRVTDFNGDGVEDIAIADPKASVGGNSGAGAVRILYGGGKGTTSVNQDLDWVPGGSEADDWFGESIDTVDYDQDGYTDLVVGTPSEDLGQATDAGMADVLYGAPGGNRIRRQSRTRLRKELPAREARLALRQPRLTVSRTFALLRKSPRELSFRQGSSAGVS